MSSTKIRRTEKTSKSKNGERTRRRSGSISKDLFSMNDIDKTKFKGRSNTIVDSPILLEGSKGFYNFFFFIRNFYISNDLNKDINLNELKYGKKNHEYHKFFNSTNCIMVDKSPRRQKSPRSDTRSNQKLSKLYNEVFSKESIVSKIMEHMEFEDLIRSLTVCFFFFSIALTLLFI